MNAYETAISLGLTGSDAEQVAILQTLGAQDVSTQDVATWLRESGLWMLGPDGPTGALQDVYSATDNETIKAGLAEFYASVFNGQASYVRVTWPQWSTKIWSVVQLIEAVLPAGHDLAERLYSLCGGRPFSDLTVEQFAAQRSAAEAPAVDPVSVTYDQRSVLLSLNLSPLSAILSCVVREAAVVDGRILEGQALATLATADATHADLSPNQRALANAVLAAVDTFVRSL